jgi:proline iminopeptidase
MKVTRRIALTAALLAVLVMYSSAQENQSPLYPEIEPLRSGYLQVSDLHKIYWEVCGDEEGIPVIVLHGGPGGSAGPEMRRYFDPKKYKMLLYDQRGAGRSRPAAEWRENTTQLLIEDINTLREHAGIEGKAILFGGSWGSTLAVAYAEAHPELVSGMVLRGVFLASRAEIDRFYYGGTADHFPENYERLQKLLPNPENKDYARQLFEMTQSDDAAVREKAINGWAFYEIRMVTMNMTDEICAQIVEDYDMTTFSVLENYYMMNGCFIDDDQLLREADRIAHIPTFIVNGRFDVVCAAITAYKLASKLKTVKLELPVAAHSTYEPSIAEALVRGVEWVAERIEKK